MLDIICWILFGLFVLALTFSISENERKRDFKFGSMHPLAYFAMFLGMIVLIPVGVIYRLLTPTGFKGLLTFIRSPLKVMVKQWGSTVPNTSIDKNGWFYYWSLFDKYFYFVGTREEVDGIHRYDFAHVFGNWYKLVGTDLEVFKGQVWKHIRNGTEYKIMAVSNMEADKPEYPITVFYRKVGATIFDGQEWSCLYEVFIQKCRKVS